MSEQISTTLFTEKCETYAKYRAGYPTEAIDLILNPYKNQQTINVIDVGAGTGIASYLLAEKGASVIAVEPNAAMIQAADYHPNIVFEQSTAEIIPVDDNFADVVTSFQAFHWFNFKKSLKEFNRVLKPSGQLALVWNYWDARHDFTVKYQKLISEFADRNSNHVSPYDKFSGFIKKWRIRSLWKLRTLPYFKNVKRHRYQYYQSSNLECLIGLAHSQSYILHSGPEWDELCARIEDLCKQEESPQLVYDINIFTAKPRK